MYYRVGDPAMVCTCGLPSLSLLLFTVLPWQVVCIDVWKVLVPKLQPCLYWWLPNGARRHVNTQGRISQKCMGLSLDEELSTVCELDTNILIVTPLVRTLLMPWKVMLRAGWSPLAHPGRVPDHTLKPYLTHS